MVKKKVLVLCVIFFVIITSLLTSFATYDAENYVSQISFKQLIDINRCNAFYESDSTEKHAFPVWSFDMSLFPAATGSQFSNAISSGALYLDFTNSDSGYSTDWYYLTLTLGVNSISDVAGVQFDNTSIYHFSIEFVMPAPYRNWFAYYQPLSVEFVGSKTNFDLDWHYWKEGSLSFLHCEGDVRGQLLNNLRAVKVEWWLDSGDESMDKMYFGMVSPGGFVITDVTDEERAQDREKEEATEAGANDVEDIESALPDDDSGGLISSLAGLFNAISYEGTDCSWPFPAIVIPEISGLVSRKTLSQSKTIDFSFWINKIPSSLMTIVQSLLTIAIILYSFYTLWNTIHMMMSSDWNRGDN